MSIAVHSYEKLAGLRSTITLKASFGYNEREGWREDGFVVSFDEEDRDAARDAVIRLAREFSQGGIFEYRSDRGVLFRRTVFCGGEEADSWAPMRVERFDASVAASTGASSLLALPWAGPKEFEHC